MIRFISRMKQHLVRPGKKPRKIRNGIFKGLSMEMDFTDRTQLYLGLYERELYKWIIRFSSRINTAIDIGAGEGEYTLYFFARTSAKKVMAFEPSAEQRRQLTRNLELNGFAADQRFRMFSKFLGTSNNQNMCTLDSLLSLIMTPCLIKIDVDGSEVNVLKGAKEFLNLSDLYWVVETHSPSLEEDCKQILNEARYVTTIVRNAWWRFFIPELRPASQNRWLVAARNAEIKR